MQDQQVEYVSRVVRTFKYKYYLSKQDAEDLKQEVILHLLEMAGDPRLADVKFFKTCVANAARDFLRSYCKHSNREESLTDAEPSIPTTTGDNYLTEQLLTQLTPKQREVVEIFFGLNSKATTDWGTIAARMHTSKQCVKNLYRSAHAVLIKNRPKMR